MLGFFRMGSMTAALFAGFALLGAFGGCGPGAGTCSGDLHSVIGADGATVATCGTDEACATTGSSAGCAKCDPTQCLPNNDCVAGWANYDDAVAKNPDNETTTCRLTCTAPSDCPFDYHCMMSDAGKGYCVKDRTPPFLGTDFVPKTPGEAAGAEPWGAPCNPTNGYADNPDCDTNQSFWCYGTSPTDGNAFCTQFQCTDDGDCPGGWWCATVNDQPNVTAAKRLDWGTTTTVCLPRLYDTKPGSYCAPCSSDLDCPKNGATPQHCVSADANGGQEQVCATECDTDNNCPVDQWCQDVGIGVNVCVPRAQTCKGDGSFCSPCHSDDDCQPNGGYCVLADYSTEHFCTAPTPTCTYSSSTGFNDTCPTLPAGAKPPNTTTDGVGCSYTASLGIPLRQCYGGNVFGLGCYTYHCSGQGGTCYTSSDCCSNSCDTLNNACK
jgi:hypothetical protein